ncbi:hypothetical protein BDQ12DRAFT_378449 [Crucibulum laeve]|uniref:DUF6697 domain-containing protein n=1 Tax=Crucibulum laeve TaxID=68775 RepID=A0A5C3LP80_9AGAR|nr:hypothetical protein BDQ12DRAFT_378449 [Crucibulum laeve]
MCDLQCAVSGSALSTRSATRKSGLSDIEVVEHRANIMLAFSAPDISRALPHAEYSTRMGKRRRLNGDTGSEAQESSPKMVSAPSPTSHRHAETPHSVADSPPSNPAASSSLTSPSMFCRSKRFTRKHPTSPVALRSTSSSESSDTLTLSPNVKQMSAGTSLEKPIAKVETKRQKRQLSIPDATIASYLGPATPLTISPPASTLYVPRKFLRLAYGGSDQHLVQFMHSSKLPSNMSLVPAARGSGKVRRFVFPMHTLNPNMPMKPGEPGLLFALRHDTLDGIWGLWCRHRGGKITKWCYLGEYKSELVGKLEKGVFEVQPDSVKQEWAELIINSKKCEPYVAMRARVALRKDGLLPVDDELKAEALVQKQMCAIKGGKGKTISVTVKELISALERGDEGIDIIRMECVDYDQSLARDVEKRCRPRHRLIV